MFICLFVCLMVLNATFNNMSVISCDDDIYQFYNNLTIFYIYDNSCSYNAAYSLRKLTIQSSEASGSHVLYLILNESRKIIGLYLIFHLCTLLQYRAKMFLYFCSFLRGII